MPTDEGRQQDSWWPLISDEARATALALRDKANELRDKGMAVYPPKGQVFRALRETTPSMVKAVIIGQDPYHGPGQAEGLCFSVAPGVPNPPSLENIFKEYQTDLGYPRPSSGSLAPWAASGVMLLNTSLTVEGGSAASHAAWGWQTLTKDVLRAVQATGRPVVFVAWGRHAKDVARDVVDVSLPNVSLIESSHPSPLSAGYGFFGSRPFTRTNDALRRMGAEPVEWRLP